MKNSLFILILLLLSIFEATSQPLALVMHNSSSGRERTISNGKKIKAYKDEDYYVRGRLNIIDSLHVTIGIDTMELGDIKNIRWLSPGRKITGVILAATGVAVLASGIIALSKSTDEGTVPAPIAGAVIESTIIGAGGVILGTGMTLTGVALIKRGKSFRRADHWEYLVR